MPKPEMHDRALTDGRHCRVEWNRPIDELIVNSPRIYHQCSVRPPHPNNPHECTCGSTLALRHAETERHQAEYVAATDYGRPDAPIIVLDIRLGVDKATVVPSPDEFDHLTRQLVDQHIRAARAEQHAEEAQTELNAARRELSDINDAHLGAVEELQEMRTRLKATSDDCNAEANRAHANKEWVERTEALLADLRKVARGVLEYIGDVSPNATNGYRNSVNRLRQLAELGNVDAADEAAEIARLTETAPALSVADPGNPFGDDEIGRP